MVNYSEPFDNYIIRLSYEGQLLKYKLRKYFSNQEFVYYHLFTKHRVIDLCWHRGSKTLSENLLPGQPGLPESFLLALQKEVANIQA